MKSNSSVKRLLCIVSVMNTGGAETFLMKLYRELDRNQYQMDFYCMSYEIGFYEEEIKKMGGIIYRSIPKSKNFFKSFYDLMKTVRDNNYDYVMRISEHSLATVDLIAAKMGGAKNLIQRSSNSNTTSQLSKFVHKLFCFFPRIIPTIKIAPSTEAAEYTFGKGCIKKHKVKIIKNAIDVEKFMFVSEKRQQIRTELNLSNEYVIGHVGRFNHQKNHDFLLDIYYEIYKKNKNSKLILVGTGELETKIKEKARILNIIENVIFMGVRSDVANIMMAFDVFVFPSLFEGMPNTVIEAQATGLNCYISDKITMEAKITDLIHFVSLEITPKEWSNLLLDNKILINRQNVSKTIAQSGYDIKLIIKEFEKTIFLS